MSSHPPKLQILLVEDSIEKVFLIRAILERGGLYQVTTSQDGDQAARLIADREFDLIITDLNIPGIDGYDLIRLIRKTQPDVPVLTITGYTANHYVEQAYRVGASYVLTKPLDHDELLKRVAELLASGAAHGPEAPVVLAIGAIPGDVEWGCGGHLLACRQDGDEILMLRNTAEAGEAERRGAERLGARIIAVEQPAKGTEGVKAYRMLLQQVIRELNPRLALIPSLADDNVDRREAHRIASVAVADVPVVLAYETPTSNADFHPGRFVDIARHLDRKLEALSGYLERGRPDFDPGFVEAAARYWGKQVRFGLAEAFEVLKDPDQTAS